LKTAFAAGTPPPPWSPPPGPLAGFQGKWKRKGEGKGTGRRERGREGFWGWEGEREGQEGWGKGRGEERGVPPSNKRARSASVLYLGPWTSSRDEIRDFGRAIGLDD